MKTNKIKVKKYHKGGDFTLKGYQKMNEENLLSSKHVREEMYKNVYVLEKVKQLLLLPSTEMGTTEQVARYYEVSISTLKSLIRDHKTELESNGFKKHKKDDILRKFLNQSFVKYERTRAIALVNGEEIVVNNTGLNLFTKRAILNVGMLLREILMQVKIY